MQITKRETDNDHRKKIMQNKNPDGLSWSQEHLINQRFLWEGVLHIFMHLIFKTQYRVLTLLLTVLRFSACYSQLHCLIFYLLLTAELVTHVNRHHCFILDKGMEKIYLLK